MADVVICYPHTGNVCWQIIFFKKTGTLRKLLWLHNSILKEELCYETQAILGESEFVQDTKVGRI